MPDPIPPFEPPLGEPSTVSADSKAAEEASCPCPCVCHMGPRPILHIRSCCPNWNGALDGTAGASLPHIEARVRRQVAEEIAAAKDVAAVERDGRLVVVSAEDIEVAVRMIGNEADICGEDCGSPYCRAWQHLRAALPERNDHA